PRIVTDREDIGWILSCVDNPHNGLTFCAGTLSSAERNDVVAMAREFRQRTHFIHLRSCELLPGGDFIEAPHTSGRARLPELVRIFEADGRNLPMRVDHGKLHPEDRDKGYPPGYSFIGRLEALRQVEGMMAATRR
ncbi:MAG: mannonate dehydratase, partial [Bacteroidales bacterium]|nr:mannonate dehydratase [Bacteroidales bacterium]